MLKAFYCHFLLAKTKGGFTMYSDKALSMQNLKGFDIEGTKKNIYNYFKNLEILEWEFAKLNAQKGLTAKYDFTVEYKRQPYTPIGKDIFNLSAKDYKEEQLKKYLSSYYWANVILSDKEQLFIKEYFINDKYDDELVDSFGFISRYSNEYKKLKRSAIYKFADFLNLVVDK